MITVIGKLKDTQKYLGVPGYNVMPDTPGWTWERNRAWLNAAIARGDSFILVSRDVSGQFAEELRYLIDRLPGIVFLSNFELDDLVQEETEAAR